MSPVRLACPLPGGAATPSARCAGPGRRRRAAARLPGRLPAGASGRKRPATPAARRSPHRSSAAGHRRYRAHRPGWRGAGRERLAFPGAARPWVHDDGRSARPVKSGPRPAGHDGRRPGAAGKQERSKGRVGGGTRAGGRPGPVGGEGRQDQARNPGRWPTAHSRRPLAGGAGWPPARDRRHQPAALPARSSPPRPRQGRA